MHILKIQTYVSLYYYNIVNTHIYKFLRLFKIKYIHKIYILVKYRSSIVVLSLFEKEPKKA